MPSDEEHDDGLGGRSRRRREVTETGRFGEELVAIPRWHLDAIPLPDEIRAAVDDGRAITSWIALKRQVGFVDALLRQLEPDALEAIEHALRNPPPEPPAPETVWRARLLDEGDEAIEALRAIRPRADRQQLRQLVRNAAKQGSRVSAVQALERALAELFVD